MATTGAVTTTRASGWQVVWPAAVGLAAAAVVVATDPNTESIVTAISVALLCYLAAAAFDRRWVAWAGCLAFAPVVLPSQVVGLAWWVVPGIVALALVVTGLLLRVPRPPLAAQTAALIGYGGVAIAVLLLAPPRLGLALAGVAVAAHGVWDVIHYRRNVVVKRSLAEACFMLDVPLGIGAVILAIID
jgi:hypothetical protein